MPCCRVYKLGLGLVLGFPSRSFDLPFVLYYLCRSCGVSSPQSMPGFGSLLRLHLDSKTFKRKKRMRAPSLLLQCFPALSPNDKPGNCGSIVLERDLHLPSPAVEILPSKNAHPYKYAGEKLDVQGLNISKGRLSVSDMIGLSYSDIVPSKSDGSLKYWESSITLVNVLKNEIRDGQLSFRGKRILELSCGSGLAGIFACLKGTSTVHSAFPGLKCRIPKMPHGTQRVSKCRAGAGSAEPANGEPRNSVSATTRSRRAFLRRQLG